MRPIPTIRKEKLPEGFSYPPGAEDISEAFDTVPHLENATIWFHWRDEYWASSWRKKIESHGSVKLLEFGSSPLSGEPVLRLTQCRLSIHRSHVNTCWPSCRESAENF